MPFAETLVRGGRMSLGMADRLLADIKPETFARKPRLGGTVVNTNHPAFVLGHLALYPARWLSAAGLDPKTTATPAGFEVFSAGQECRDDERGTISPPMNEIVEAFKRTHTVALDQLAKLSDEKLRAPNPHEGRIREMFPTLDGVLMFYMTSHMM